MTIETHAFARIGLIGNPSDGYGGKTISAILRNFRATVTCEESPRLTIVPRARDRLEFDGVDALVDEVRRNGYYGGVRLIKATIKRFAEYCHECGIELDDRAFSMRYDTDIPTRVGLAGSSAIVIAVFRALMRFYEVEIPDSVLPNLALSVEVDELKIPAGLQDRVVQTLGGVVYMDFDPHRAAKDGGGVYEVLDPGQLPPLFVAFDERLSEGTEVVHSGLKRRFEHGDVEVVGAMRRFAQFAQEARDLIVAGRGAGIGGLMNANFDLRAQLVSIGPGERALVEAARQCGAAAKFTGSGGAVVGVYDGDPGRFERLQSAYARLKATIIVPEI